MPSPRTHARRRPRTADAATTGLRTERAAATRATLLRVARGLFTEGGYWATSLEDVVAGTGLTHGAVYHHFGSKQGLFVAVFEEVEHEWKAPIQRGIASGAELWLQFLAERQNPDVDQWGVYVEGCSDMLDRAVWNVDERAILYRDGPSVLGWDDWRRLRDRAWSQGFHDAAVTSAASAGLIRCQSPTTLARMLYTLLEELTVDLGREPAPEAALPTVRREYQGLLEGLRVTPG